MLGRFFSAVIAVGFAALLSNCSLLHELETSQCSRDADCKGALAGRTCSAAGVCVAPLTGSGGEGGGSGGSSGAGGNGGGSTAECTTNAQCAEKYFGSHVCKAGECIDLVTKECPVVIGKENLQAEEVITFGAYANAPNAANLSLVSRNISLAINEITSKVTGLRGGPNNSKRTLAVVVCNSQVEGAAPGTITPFEPSLTHLVDRLQVPGIIAALDAHHLDAIFRQRLLGASGPFVISGLEANGELVSMPDDGRLWHMLGPGTDLAPVYLPLVQRIETFMRKSPDYLKLGPSGKFRVAVVTAELPLMTDIRDAISPQLQELYEFRPIQTQSSVLVNKPQVDAAATALFDFAPHIIVSLGTSEFVSDLLPLLESAWNNETGDQQRPFYVFSATQAHEAYTAFSTNAAKGAGWLTFTNRAVGVTYASAEETQRLSSYESRLLGANLDVGDAQLLKGGEAFYDATYLMVYAAAAAGDRDTLTGSDLSRGMLRLVSGTNFEVGPAQIPTILTALDTGDNIGLNMVVGPADWVDAVGTRKTFGNVYCLSDGKSPEEMTAGSGPYFDALLFDRTTATLDSGPIPCFVGF